MTGDSAHHLAIMQARNKAFRWPKGTSGNPSGRSRFYHEARKLAREASPEMMKVLIGLARDTQADERVRSVCAMAVLDRGGVRGFDFDPKTEEGANLKRMSDEELGEQMMSVLVAGGMLERTAQAWVNRQMQGISGEPEIIPPEK